MKRVAMTSQWIEAWRPNGRQEVADRNARGLFLRARPNGPKVFYCWQQAKDEKGNPRRRRLRLGAWPMLSLAGAQKMVQQRRETQGQASFTATVGDLLDLFLERGQASRYTAGLLWKHLEAVRPLVAATLAPVVLSDLVAKVQKGYEDGAGRHVGGAAVADKVRSGLRKLFAWAQRQGRFPADRPLPTLGLVKEDFKGIGWRARERVPSEGELHRLLDALGIGTGAGLDFDMKVSPRIPLATRLAVLLLAHLPVRSGVGLLSQPAGAADLEAGMLRWATRKGGRDDAIETPLSTIARAVVERLRKLPGGETWLVPSPEDPKQPIDMKTVARVFARLQRAGPDGEAPRVTPDDGKDPFVPHTLRALWTSLAGELGVDDGVAVRVIGHKPEGASAAQKFYDRSKRLDKQREAVERVSAELERIRRRLPREAAAVVPLAMAGAKVS